MQDVKPACLGKVGGIQQLECDANERGCGALPDAVGMGCNVKQLVTGVSDDLCEDVESVISEPSTRSASNHGTGTGSGAPVGVHSDKDSHDTLAQTEEKAHVTADIVETTLSHMD